MSSFWYPLLPSCTISETFVEIKVRGHSRSLEMVPFDRLHMTSRKAVTIAELTM